MPAGHNKLPIIKIQKGNGQIMKNITADEPPGYTPFARLHAPTRGGQGQNASMSLSFPPPSCNTMASKKAKIPITAPESKPAPKSTKPTKSGSEPGKPVKSDTPKSSKPASKVTPKKAFPPHVKKPDFKKKGIRGGRGGSRINTRIATRLVSKQKLCRDFLSNNCPYGPKCKFFHPKQDHHSKDVMWFSLCYDHHMGNCGNRNCSDLHVLPQDEDMFRNTGEIAAQLVDAVIQKSSKGNITLIGTTPCCKNFLRGVCNVPDCHKSHVNRKDYEFEVFNALRDEMDRMLASEPPFAGQPGPGGPPMEHFEGPMDAFEPPMQSGPPMYREDVMMDDMHRGRHFDGFDGGPEFVIDDMRDVRPVREVWDERDRFDPGIDEMRQEIASLRNENVDLRRSFETEIGNLKVDLNRVTVDNSRLRSEIMEKDTEIAAITATNTTLVEGRQKAVDHVHHLEQSNQEMRRQLEMGLKSVGVDQGKIEALNREVAMLKNSLDKADALIKKTGDENRRLMAELMDERNKIQELHATRTQQMGMANRDMLPDGRWNQPQHPHHPGGGVPNPEWNRQDTSSWDQRNPPSNDLWDQRNERDQWNQHNQHNSDRASRDRGRSRRDNKDRSRSRVKERENTWQGDIHNPQDNQPQGAYNGWREGAEFGGRRGDMNPPPPQQPRHQMDRGSYRNSGAPWEYN